MADANDWSFWQAALAGKPMVTEPGNPRTGYYRSQTGKEVLAIWRDADGALCCEITGGKYGDGSNLSADQIDERFSWVCRYPISYDLFVAVKNGGELPPEYTTRLTPKEIQNGVVWTPELGKKRLGLDPERYDEHGNERPGIGHNNAPEDLSPDQALAKRVHDLGVQCGDWLKGIGDGPRSQAEAEILSGYANKFKDFENEAVAAHKAEKAPHLETCRLIDAKWFAPVRDKAIASRDKIIAMIRAWTKAEDDRKAKEAQAARDAAQAAAIQASADAPATPVAAYTPEPTKVSTLRGTGKRERETLIADLPAFLAYCASLNETPPDIVEAAEKVARKWKAANFKAPGMVTAEQNRGVA